MARKKKEASVFFAYRPREVARLTPRRLLFEGEAIAIGGEVTVNQRPPKLPRTVREATPEEYEKLYQLGYTHLIERVKVSGAENDESEEDE